MLKTVRDAVSGIVSTDMIKPSDELLDYAKPKESVQTMSKKGDPISQMMSQKNSALGAEGRGSEMMTERNATRVNASAAVSRASDLASKRRAPTQPRDAGMKSYAETPATPVLVHEGHEGRETPSMNIRERTHSHSQQLTVRGQPTGLASVESERRGKAAMSRYAHREDRSQSELVELHRKIKSYEQDREAMLRSMENTERKLEDSNRRNRDLEEYSRRRSEELRVTTSHLRQAEELQRQTLALLEVKTSELKGAHAFLSKEDALAGADLIGMVDSLNAEILQVAAFMADSVENLDRDEIGAVDEGIDTQLKTSIKLGEAVIRALRSNVGHSEFDPLPVQVALQICLVSVSSMVVQSWIPGNWDWDNLLSTIYSDIRTTEGQSISGRWRALTCNHTRKYWRNSEKNMMMLIAKEVANVLVLAGHRRQLIELNFLDNFRERLEMIVQLSLRINEATHEYITSGDVHVIVVPPGERFNPSTMDDGFLEGEGSKDRGEANQQGIVAGTTDLGIQLAINNASIPSILKNPKVVLVSTLSF